MDKNARAGDVQLNKFNWFKHIFGRFRGERTAMAWQKKDRFAYLYDFVILIKALGRPLDCQVKPHKAQVNTR